MIHGRELSDPTAQIDALDGIRGLAVLLVLLSHLSLANLPLVPGFNFAHLGKSGVYLFFALSAFLLMAGFLRLGRENLGWRHLVLYAVRRVLRIGPLYVLFLPIGYAELYRLRQGQLPGIDWAKLLQALTLQRGDGVNWSVVVEVKFYLILPLIAAAYLLWGRARWKLAVAILGVLAALVALAFPIPDTGPIASIFVVPHLPVFLLGCAAAIVFYDGGLASSATARRWHGGVAFIAIASATILIMLCAKAFIDGDLSDDMAGRWVLLWAMLWTTLIVATLAGGAWPRRLFELGWLRRVGQLSFGSYLIHAYLITIVPLAFAKAGLGFPTLQAWATVFITFALAEILFRAIERPCARSHWVERLLDLAPARRSVGQRG